MKLSDRDILDLNELVSAALDGRLSEPGRARFEGWLRQSEEARRLYARMMELSAALCAIADRSEAEEEADEPRSPSRRPSRWRFAAWALAAAALVAALFVAARPLRRDGPPATVATVERMGPGDRPSPTPATSRVREVAVLARAIDPVWGPTALPTEVGAALPAGRLRLVSGLIQLEFYGGASVVLEGPADFEILAADRAFCRQGKLRARVPLDASRFSVATPSADVIDLGTEFGVLVDAKGGSEVRVFEGSVALHGHGPSRAVGRQLTTGEGVRIDDSGAARAAEADPDSFVGARELQRRSSTESGRRYRAWLALSRKLQADPRVLVYYSFEGQQPWERTLLDWAPDRGPKRNGAIVGCDWSEGRWPGKAALDFKRRSDRVRVHVPGEFAALTLMTWVRVDYFDNRLNSLLLADGWDVPGEVHWELDGNGSLIFYLKRGAWSVSPVVLGDSQLGLWTHLATVYAPAQRSLTHYVNGRAVSRVPIPETSRANIGWASLGNYSNPAPTEKPDRLIRNLNGRIDEFLIFDQALDAREIEAIYEAGKPAS